MLAFMLLLLVGLVPTSANLPEIPFNKVLSSVILDCNEEFKLPIDFIHKLRTFSVSPVSVYEKCFLSCCMKKLGIMNKKYEFVMPIIDEVISQTFEQVTVPVIKGVVRGCLEALPTTEKNECEMASFVYTCFREQAKEV